MGNREDIAAAQTLLNTAAFLENARGKTDAVTDAVTAATQTVEIYFNLLGSGHTDKALEIRIHDETSKEVREALLSFLSVYKRDVEERTGFTMLRARMRLSGDTTFNNGINNDGE